MADLAFQKILDLGPDTTPYRLVTKEHVSTVDVGGTPYLRVAPEGLALLAKEAMHEIAHFLRPGHLAQLRTILDDPEASANDRFVALDLLKNAVIAAAGILPMCQDTGTAIVMGKKGDRVLSHGDEKALAKGILTTRGGTAPGLGVCAVAGDGSGGFLGVHAAGHGGAAGGEEEIRQARNRKRWLGNICVSDVERSAADACGFALTTGTGRCPR